MIFFVRHGGKEYRVRVESRDRLMVQFQDEPEEAVDLMFYGHDCTFIHNNRVFFANVVGNKNDFTVWRPEGNVQFAVDSEYRRIVNILRGQDLGQESQVFAKMPGKIVKVLVKEGDKVKKGAAMMVMEAMKMENEIRAGFSGDVAQICVREGQAVETGTLLMEVNPQDEEG